MDVKEQFVQKFYDTLYEESIPDINLSDSDCLALIPLFEDILEGSLSYGSGFRSKSLNNSEESGANESNESKEETLENGVSAVEPVKELLEAMNPPGVSAVEPVKELLDAMHPPGVSAVEPVKELLDGMHPGPESVPELGPSSSASSGLSVGPSASASSNANQPIIETIIPIIDILFDSFKEETKNDGDPDEDSDEVYKVRLVRKLEKANEEKNRAIQKVATVTKLNEEVNTELEEVNTELEKTKKEVDRLLSEKETLSLEIASTKAQLEKEINLINEEKSKLKLKLENEQIEKGELEITLKNVETRKKVLLNELTAKIKQQDIKEKKLQKHLDAVKERRKVLSEQSREKAAQLQEAKAQLQEAGTQLEEAGTQLEEAKAQLEEAKAQLQESKGKENVLIDATSKLAEQSQAARKSAEALHKSEIEKLARQLEEANAAAERAKAETKEAQEVAEKQRLAAEAEAAEAAKAAANIARLTEEKLQAEQQARAAAEARLAAEAQSREAAEEKARAATGQAEQQARAAAEALKNAQSREEAAIKTSRVKEAALEKSMEERIVFINNNAQTQAREATEAIAAKLAVEQQKSVTLAAKLEEVSAELKKSQENKEVLEAVSYFQKLKAATEATEAAKSFVEHSNEEDSEEESNEEHSEESKEEHSEESKEGMDPAYNQLKEELVQTKENITTLEAQLQEAKERSTSNQLQLQSLRSTLGNVAELKTKLEQAEAQAEEERRAAAQAAAQAAAAAAAAQAQAESNARSLQIEIDQAKAQAAAVVAAAAQVQAEAQAEAQAAREEAQAAREEAQAEAQSARAEAQAARAEAQAAREEAQASAQAAQEAEAKAQAAKEQTEEAQAAREEAQAAREEAEKQAQAAQAAEAAQAAAESKAEAAEKQAAEAQAVAEEELKELKAAAEELKKLKAAAEDKAKEAQATLKSDIKTISELAEARAGLEPVELNHEETTEIGEAMEEASRQARDKVLEQIKDFNRRGHHINMKAGKVSLALRRLHRLNAREKKPAISAQVSLPKPILDEFLNEPQIQCIDSEVKPITPINIKENDVPILNPPETPETTETPETLIDKLVQTLETQMSIDQTSVHEKLFSCLKTSNQGEPSNQSCETKLESANLMVKNGSDALILADLKEARDELKDDDKTREILAHESGVDKMVEVKQYKYTATNEAADQSNAYTRATIAWIDTGMEWLYAYSKCKDKGDLLYNANIAFGNAIKLYNSATQLLDLAFRYSTRQFRLPGENKLLNYQATKTQKEAMTASMNLTFAKNRLDAISNDMNIDIYNIDKIFIVSSHVKDIDELYQYIWSNKLYQHTFFTPSEEVNRINVYYKEATTALADANQTLNQDKIHCQSIGHPINLDSKFEVSLDTLKRKKLSLKESLMTRYEKELAAAKSKVKQGSNESIETELSEQISELSEQISELDLDDDSGVFSESNLSKQLNELYSRKPIKENVPDDNSSVSGTNVESNGESNGESNVESNVESTDQEKWMKYARKQTNSFNFQSKHHVNGSDESPVLAPVLAEKPPSETPVLAEKRNVNPVIEELNNLRKTLHRDYPSRTYTINALIDEKIKLLRLDPPDLSMEHLFNAKVDKLKLKPDLSKLLKSV